MSSKNESIIGEIAMDWSISTIGEIANVTKLAGYEYTKHIKYNDEGEIIALRALNVRDGVLDLNNLKRIFKSVSDELPRSKLFKDDILFTYVGANIGQFALVPEDDKFHLAPNICRIRTNKDYYSKFLYYFFRTYTFKKMIEGFTNGSSQGTLPMGNIRLLTVPKTGYQEQKSIADVLTAFDDKIELLQAQNKTLEETAQTIFKEWFGKYQIGDELPEGWRVGKLGEVTKSVGGTTPSTKNNDFWGGNIFWTSPKDLSNSKEMFLLDTEKKITTTGLKKISSGLLPKKTLLLSSRAPVGYLSLTNIELAINQGYIALLPNQYLSNNYMYLWLNLNMKTVENAANGSTFLEISKSSFRNIDCLIPEQNCLQKFDEFVYPMFEKILSNLNQIQTLTQTRDALLPKLMSGQIRVNELTY